MSEEPPYSARDRSLTADLDDSDSESHNGSHKPGKPGRKKNPNSQAARRDQNRIAQREFRLRKQQRIRDLEARVEILSGGKDEALGEMRNILKDLMQENQTLRTLLRSLGSFIGEGAGGLLPKLGWDMADFNNFINKSETDTAWESFQRRKKTVTQVSSSTATQGEKRSATEDSFTSQPKKPRHEPEKEGDREQDSYFLVPMSNGGPSATAGSLYQSTSRPASNSHMFPDLIRPQSGPLFTQGSAATSTSGQYDTSPAASNMNTFQSYIQPLNINVESPTTLPAVTLPPSSNGTIVTQPRRASQTTTTTSPEQIDEEDPKKNEAYKLINYHLDNYKRNSAYCLPSSLRPTLVQRTVPHESVIDHILHPELRDRMILLRGRFDLVDSLLDYRTSVTIHGDDVLAHSNWEIAENWLRKYGFLIDQATLNIANRWRRERGESELRLSDIGPGEPTPTTA